MNEYTVSKDRAMKLKEAGFPQDNILFSYYADIDNWDNDVLDLTDKVDSDYSDCLRVSAPLTDEILERLPIQNQISALRQFANALEDWELDRCHGRKKEKPNLPDALADIYCYLSGEGLL